MVQSKPYVRWKIINETQDEVSSANPDYLWATTIEANQGPIDIPTRIPSPDYAKRVFGLDFTPFFNNGGKDLVVVRVAAGDPYPGTAAINGSYKYTIVKGINELPNYTVEIEDKQNGKGSIAGLPIAQYKIKFINDNGEFYADEVLDVINPSMKYDLNFVREEPSFTVPTVDVVVDAKDGKISGFKEANYFIKLGEQSAIVTVDGSKTEYPFSLSATEKEFPQTQLVDEVIDGTLIALENKNKGTSSVSVSYRNSLSNGYSITISEDNFQTSTITAKKLADIVNKINDKAFNLKATLTDKGAKVDEFIFNKGISTSTIPQIGSLRAKDAVATIEEPETPRVTISGSNGLWDETIGRIPEADGARIEAHKRGLKRLEGISLCGVFCMYGDANLQDAYMEHVVNMNADDICKWRFGLLGANEAQMATVDSLIDRCQSFNNERILYLGQGLVVKDEVKNELRTLKPYECTLHVAGLRSGLFYGTSIFGGQSSKQIRGHSTKLSSNGKNSIAEIAPLANEEVFAWEPQIYTELNEAGVLTFTDNYGQISLTDGVTSSSNNDGQEDEEGVMSIVRYAQKKVHDVCVEYIGMNMTEYTRASLEQAIINVLEVMKTTDATLQDVTFTDGTSLKAYDVDVMIDPISNRTLGKVYVYLALTPIHALRQIEVEMTVQ